MIKIFLVDDHRIIRDGIKAMLENTNIQVIGEAENYQGLSGAISNGYPDIFLMDISLPEKSGIEIAKEILSKNKKVKIILLTMYIDETYIDKALKIGVSGYLHKNTTRQELIHAITEVYNNKLYFSDAVSKIITGNYVKKISTTESTEKVTLTKREKEILKLFSEGFINKEIAEKLFISIRTVETHKNHIMQKLGLKTQVELVKYAIKANLTEI